MKSLTVFYDETCAFCIRCRDWLWSEEQIVPLILVEKRLLAARYPQLEAYAGGSDLVAVSDEGDVWIGDAAFLTILFSLERYRGWAGRLSGPSLRPYAKRFFEMVSNNRGRISWLLGSVKDERMLAGALSAMPVTACEDSSCGRNKGTS
jgi:predicted DCC family thiol-disulfide oxidoreductase YuxK